MEDLLRVGVITQTHGLRGEVKVFPTTDDPTRFKKKKDYIIQLRRETLSLQVESAKFFKQYVILKFKGYDTIESIEPFIKKDLLVTRDNAISCKPGQFFICDLIGLDVVTDDGMKLGTLTDILETGANNVYEVTTPEGKQVLIPSIPQCILNHDLDNKVITVHLLDGLLDLN